MSNRTGNKKRFVNTRLWSDNWVVELDPIERYLFLYFITNEHTNIAGIYELPLRVMAFETGLDKEMIEKMMKRFEGRIYHIEGWIYIKNFIKHQELNPSIEKGIENIRSEVPNNVLEVIDSLSTECIESARYSNSNSNRDSNSNSNRDRGKLQPVKKEEVKQKFGEFGNVLLKEEEHQRLVSLMGENNVNALIFELDTYIASKGKKYKSHYATIQSWARRKSLETASRSKGKKIQGL